MSRDSSNSQLVSHEVNKRLATDPEFTRINSKHEGLIRQIFNCFVGQLTLFHGSILTFDLYRSRKYMKLSV
jgi:hypothetical protein